MELVQKKIVPEDVLEMDSGEKYDLVAIVNHYGFNLNHGHYVTFVKKNDIWFKQFWLTS